MNRFLPAGILLVFLVLRAAPIASDPPDALVTHYHDAASSVFDEGWWTAAARDRVLFGDPFAQGFDLFWISPVFTGAVTAAFAALGVSLTSARVVPLLFGAIGLLALLRIDFGSRTRGAGALASLFLAVSFAAAHLGRMALPEPVGTGLGLAAAYLLLRGGGMRELLAGTAAGLAILTKPHFAFLAPTLLASAAVLAVRHGRSVIPAASRVAAGVVLPLAVWSAVLLIHREEAGRLFAFYDMGRWVVRNPQELGVLVAAAKPAVQGLVVGVIYRHTLLAHLPVVFVLAALAAPAAWTAALRPARRRDVPDAVLVFGLWTLFDGAFLAMLPYQPFRYFGPLLPALCVLAAWALTGDREEAAAGPAGAVLRWGAAALVLAQGAFAALLVTVVPRLVARAAGGDLDPLHPTDRFGLTSFLVELARARSLAPFDPLPVQQAHFAALVLCGVAAASVGAIGATLLAPRLRRIFSALDARRLRAAAPLVLVVQALLWALWLPGRGDTLRAMGRDLGERLPAGAVVSPGGTFALENGVRYDSRAVRDGRMYDASGERATHFVCLEGHPGLGRIRPGGVEALHPGAVRLRGYRLTGDYLYGLYRAPGRSPD